MTEFQIRAGERREIVSAPGGVGAELVFTAERIDGGVPTGTVEETRAAMYGAAVNKHPLLAENRFRLGRYARTRTRFRIAVVPDQDVTVRITAGFVSPGRMIAIVLCGSVAILALIGAVALFA